MSIGKQVSETIDKMEAKDPEGALYAICSAIDATAKKESGETKVGIRYKEFIHQNLGLITDIAFGIPIQNYNLKFEHEDLKPDAKGLVSIQDIFYHVVRCGLFHETEIPAHLKFHEENSVVVKDGKLFLPQSLIYGLLVAVITSPVNSAEKATKEAQVNLGGSFPIPLSCLWGRRSEMLWLLGVNKEIRRLMSEASKAQGQGNHDKTK
jgi:hypothetical protein